MRQKKSKKVVNLLKTHPHTYIITDNFWGPHGLSETLSRHIIDIEDSVRLSHIFSQLNEEPVEIIIHSTGASVASSDVMLRIIHEYPGQVDCYIPIEAFSAAALISLGCDHIHMNPTACLGPVDTQYNIDDEYYSVHSIAQSVQSKKIKELDGKMLINYYESIKYNEDSIRNLHRVLDNKYPRRTVKRIIRELNSGIYPHSKPFTVSELREMGLTVSTDIPYDITYLFNELMALMNCY